MSSNSPPELAKKSASVHVTAVLDQERVDRIDFHQNRLGMHSRSEVLQAALELWLTRQDTLSRVK